jgi:hypothetical protein
MTNYKFQDIDGSKEISSLKSTENELNIKQQQSKNIKVSDITHGGIFDLKAFNKKVDKVNKINREKSRIKQRIKQLQLKYKPLDYNKLTIEELKNSLLLDTYDMVYEIFSMEKFSIEKINIILSKNYRKLTILFILLIICIFSYILINFLSE